MASVPRPTTATARPLVAGERLDQATFHELYEQMPPRTRAELVGGVVYMPSPASTDHGKEWFNIIHVLGHYRLHTPGLEGLSDATLILSTSSEPQPDAILRLTEELGGQSRTQGKYLAGAPELVVEVARSSKSFDLGAKRRDYERAGVREYLVIALDPDEIHWFVRRNQGFERLSPGEDGVYRSEVFPGLWLDAAAFFRNDLKVLIATVDRGLASEGHQRFVAELAARKPTR